MGSSWVHDKLAALKLHQRQSTESSEVSQLWVAVGHAVITGMPQLVTEGARTLELTLRIPSPSKATSKRQLEITLIYLGPRHLQDGGDHRELML